MPEINIVSMTATTSGTKWMELDQGNSTYADFPGRIIVLGSSYYKTSWNSDHNIVTYRTQCGRA